MADTLIWAHRGDSVNAPENTLPAFASAIDARADGIELDVRRTRDGVVVISHDVSADRCSDGKGRVCDLTLAELRGFDFSHGKNMGYPVRIATLEEALALVKPSGLLLNIELKGDGPEDAGLIQAVLELVSAADMGGRVVYSSFEMRQLAALRERDTGARIAILFDIGSRAPWGAARELKAEAMHAPAIRLRTRSFIDRCRTESMNVRVWTLDRPQGMRRALALGVDGIITNDPRGAMVVRG